MRSFIISSQNIRKIKSKWMRWAGVWEEMHAKSLWENLKGRNLLGNVGTDERITLK
jgi:hypothetical protein